MCQKELSEGCTPHTGDGQCDGSINGTGGYCECVCHDEFCGSTVAEVLEYHKEMWA